MLKCGWQLSSVGGLILYPIIARQNLFVYSMNHTPPFYGTQLHTSIVKMFGLIKIEELNSSINLPMPSSAIKNPKSKSLFLFMM